MMDTFIYLFISVIAFFSYAFCSFSFLEHYSFKNLEVSHRIVGGVWVLLPNGISHFIAENSEKQNFVFGVE